MTKTIIKREFRRHVFMLSATLAIMLLMSSCGIPNTNSIEELPATRFVEVHHSKHSFTDGDTIYMDTETGVLYYYHTSGYGGGLSVMYDKDGNVLTGK